MSLHHKAEAARAQLGTLQAEQQRLSQERAALLHRVAQLEQALRQAPAAAPAAITPDADRSDLRRRVAQLEQSLRAKEQKAATERSQCIAAFPSGNVERIRSGRSRWTERRRGRPKKADTTRLAAAANRGCSSIASRRTRIRSRTP